MPNPTKADSTHAGAATPASSTIRETVALFDDPKRMEDAFVDLQTVGFDHAEISVLANREVIEEQLGRMYPSTAQAAGDPNAPRDAVVQQEVSNEARAAAIGIPAYIGALAAAAGVVATGGIGAAVAAAVVGGGAGGLLGGVLSQWLGSRRSEYFKDQIERGGILMWVRTPDEASEERARQVLERHGGRDVHAQDLPVPG